MESIKNNVPPNFWKVEDGNFYLADPRDIKRCEVCNKWYLKSNFLDKKNICTLGCHLKLTDVLSKGN